MLFPPPLFALVFMGVFFVSLLLLLGLGEEGKQGCEEREEDCG